MKVVLASVGNPDFRQDPDKPLFGCEPNKTVEVKDMKEARDKCMAFIQENDLGGGNWAGGEIMDEKGKVIAIVSYNGRVWEGSTLTGNNKQIIL